MRSTGLNTRIFLDGGDPKETREILELLGFLDGQTTNPTLISRNAEVKARLSKNKKFSVQEIYEFYREVVKELAALIPEGSISIEVYADKNTSAKEMLAQGRQMYHWIPNAHIKFPTTAEGLQAAKHAVEEGMRVNMTLCFTQAQAAAVYAATLGARRGQVLVSPFVGRLDDRGENGMDLIGNIIKMYKQGDNHVEVLTASVRTLDHLLDAIALKADIVTAPAKILHQWSSNSLSVPDVHFKYGAENLKPIPYKEIDLTKSWREFNINHDLTDAGLKSFSNDWNSLIQA
ncbi:transaldolase [Candidatus Uhrbacteria bacterium RIFCSPLOWO2_01_FULL_47_24]|uniref:Transaldolase n=1 Tax=Candidatus Uhrbacteria bacterium RIFCSPLOWO2_01_FULL_47_24 TaxID=1802401 RepID=A0A1F7USW1_9BACT|nr:MAG: transaldolase [Candidatus Uhrbacteria bacterium RIFCSPHIGHO2_01_FULL_47_11]OGL69032.1 MAG: transaldolase [Candidatus Uhrbacteria bacterium RIFCSPHIGHO2_02_FULL_46_47]OGL76312.1 MAG: transaldolase [Candidatus Uhrbacteria bacterium RIFCSPHIGHO2_12_FULL_47_11]OGL81346.1 MAG: transaldolase [Candidatus Uhrbacteria bacterium RIFCSPLOWO2_01_FULL_47_24]OGL91632.1 MAG: transaldolase [Candidatus Uhrbacteria bacterium RIFCSPLOWO2_12_FULL_47_10]